MSMYPNSRYAQAGYLDNAIVARFMNAVYAWMSVGLAITALVAFVVASDQKLVRSIFTGGTFVVLLLVELGLVFVIGHAINRISSGMATVLFLVYAALNGMTLSVIFLIYSLPSIFGTFIVTAGMFGAASLYGFVTKRDLGVIGRILFMALIGLILATVVNIFFAKSSGLYWITTYAGVIIFTGLTAYDTQKLKEIAAQTAGAPELASRLAIVGSLSLYLDFVNLFLYLLRLLGKRR